MNARISNFNIFLKLEHDSSELNIAHCRQHEFWFKSCVSIRDSSAFMYYLTIITVSFEPSKIKIKQGQPLLDKMIKVAWH